MTTISGSILSDISGHGNDGTLSGTSVISKGVTLNGSSDYITIPAIVKNSDFTVVVVLTGDTNGGAIWFEGDTGLSSFMRMSRALNTPSRISSSGGDSGLFGPSTPAFSKEYHSYYLRRNGSTGDTGLVDVLVYRGSASIPGTPNFGGDTCASLGAQSFGSSCASHNAFLAGTLAYFVLYNKALSDSELKQVHDTIRTIVVDRNIYLQEVLTPPAIPGPIWARQGTVIATSAQEPTLLYEPVNGQLISGPCLKMWYDRGSALAYAESSDGLSWTLYGPDVCPKQRPSIIKSGGIYYALVEQVHSAIAQTAFDVYTSSDGLSFSLAHSSVLTRGSAGSYDDTTINNPCWILENGIWYLAHEGIGTGTSGTQISMATSPDGINFTKLAANPISGWVSGSAVRGRSPEGPFIYHSTNGNWYVWGGDDNGIVRYQASSINTLWTQFIVGTETYSPDSDQHTVSDPCLIEFNGKTFMYYGATSPLGAGTIGLAIANMTMEQLILTTEGAIP